MSQKIMVWSRRLGIFVVLFACMLSFVTIPVNAATYSWFDYKDHIYFENSGDNSTTYSVVVPQKYWYWQGLVDSIGENVEQYSGDTFFFDTTGYAFPIDIAFRPTGFNVLNVTNIPDGSRFRLNSTFNLTYKRWVDAICIYSFRFYYYGVNGDYLGQEVVVHDYFDLDQETLQKQLSFDDVEFTLNKPGGTACIMPVIRLSFDGIAGANIPPTSDYPVKVQVDHFRFFLDIDNDYLALEREEENNQLLQDIQLQNEEMIDLQTQENEKLDDIQDTLEEAPEKEKQEASDSGDSNVGEVLEVIPDDSEGFMSALEDFADSMSYSGTDAKLTIPAIVIPEIPGLIPEFKLLDKKVLDFGQFFKYLPNTLLLLVQSLLTIALIVYCFKELYDTIAYVMTLRKGEN